MSKKKPRKQSLLKIESVQQPDGTWALMVRSMAGLNPAGTRLSRGGSFPIWEFDNLTEAQARKSANDLQDYLNKEDT